MEEGRGVNTRELKKTVKNFEGRRNQEVATPTDFRDRIGY